MAKYSFPPQITGELCSSPLGFKGEIKYIPVEFVPDQHKNPKKVCLKIF